jgi:DNA mismatch endonuclease (patch repair protein)
MARIRKKDSRPELIVRRLLHAMGYRYRLHDSSLPGNPDIVLKRHRKVIFVHGYFWHRHDCPDGRKLPKSKPDYWGPKLEGNRRRDQESIKSLRAVDWHVITIWECETRNETGLGQKLSGLLQIDDA